MYFPCYGKESLGQAGIIQQWKISAGGGTLGEKFYIVSHGIVKIYNNSFNQYGFISDYFGEAALTTKSKRLAKYFFSSEPFQNILLIWGLVWWL